MDYRKKQRRRQTFNEPRDAHELTFSCYRPVPFLSADRTCEWLAQAINDARTAFDFALWDFVFMPQDVHIIVYPRRLRHSVAAIREAIKEPVGRKAIRFLHEHACDCHESRGHKASEPSDSSGSRAVALIETSRIRRRSSQ